jgi:hypothetical protein
MFGKEIERDHVLLRSCTLMKVLMRQTAQEYNSLRLNGHARKFGVSML